jgi:pyruvate,water dikinase
MRDIGFIAPGPGVWELDYSHFTRPMTLFSKEMFTDSLVKGLKEGTARYGLALSHLTYEMVNGFFYKKAVLCGLPDDHCGVLPADFFERSDILERFQKGQEAFERKLWRTDLKKWDEEVKPDSIRRNKKLQEVDLSCLTQEELIKHLHACRENALEMMYRHHQFTIPAILPIGLYLLKAITWTGLSSAELLYLLKGTTPISRGAAEVQLKILVSCLKRENLNPEDFRGYSPENVLTAIKKQTDFKTQQALEGYLNEVGYRLMTGYDITDKYGFDMPEILVSNIWTSYCATNTENNRELQEKETMIRYKVPYINRSDFDILLSEARIMNRLRDERGIYNDVLGTGLARRAILEAGKRLNKQGILSNDNLFLYADYSEMISMLKGKTGPSNDELKERAEWCNTKTVDDAPLTLGEASVAMPSITAFPESVRVNMMALFTAIKEIYDDAENKNSDNASIIQGFPVNAGVYEGTARIIKSLDDFKLLQPGDVLVTKNTTAAFNAILPLLGAIVTDRGGQLSHAAIVSREFGIPGVVSTQNATQRIQDGARVRVDGLAGTVEIL